MKMIKNIILAAAAALALTSCTPTATNAPANASNSNANASKPTAAAPTKEALLEMDKKANVAYVSGDSKTFEEILSEKFVMYPGGERVGKADAVKMIAGVKCDSKDISLEDPQMAMIDADTYVLSYKTTYGGLCSEGTSGKMVRVPPARAVSVWARNGEKWQAVFHGENEMIDPSKASAANKGEAPKKEEPKKENKDADKSGEAKKGADASGETKKDDKSAANSSNGSNTSQAKASPDANTDALVQALTAGWEAWKAKDAKKFEETTTANLSSLDPMGTWHGTKADTIKYWTEMKCEGVTKVTVKDGFATAISPTVEVLTAKGSADGSCEGQKNTELTNVAFFVKEGTAWKLAFLFEGM